MAYNLISVSRPVVASFPYFSNVFFRHIFYVIMANTFDRSCDVEIGKSSLKDETFIEEKVKKEIEELLDSADPYQFFESPVSKSSSLKGILQKYELVASHFEKLAAINKFEPEIDRFNQDHASCLSAKRKFLLKFTDNSREDEIFNRDLVEIPAKLREEISNCQQVVKNLLNDNFFISTHKLHGYLEILHECNLLKIHSDPVCLFIQDEESKGLFEDIIKLTCTSNTYKTYILRIFLAHESGNNQQLLELHQEILKSGFLDDKPNN